MVYYYIDFENVQLNGLKGIEELEKKDKVLIYCRETDIGRIKTALYGVDIKPSIICRIVNCVSKNALDFELISDLFMSRSKCMKVTGGKRLGKEAYDNSDPSQYAKKNFGMFAGEEATVRIEFPKEKVGIFLDQFGKDIIVVPSNRKGFYNTSVDVYTSDHFFGWIFAIGPEVRIIGPDHIVEKYKSAIQERLEQI